MVDDPDFVKDAEHQIRIPQVEKVIPPGSIKICFDNGDPVRTPFIDERDFIPKMMQLYPSRLTIDQLIVKAEQELRILQNTIGSIRVDRGLIKNLVSQIVLTSSMTPGCNLAVVGKDIFIQSITKVIDQTILSIADEIQFPNDLRS